MRKLYICLFYFALFSSFPFLSKADTLEIAGAEMTYKWISGNTYEANLNMYTTCNSLPLDSVWIKISSPESDFKPYKKLAKLVSICKISNDCLAETSCDNPNSALPGFWKWKAIVQFTLSRNEYCRYIFSWDTC
ncbi:MAG: hypothetical protein EOP53_12170 [Sphingobacteriales bacterium]|nr:MAG: hypothetical protein EOP53_12170 [Sphingobacteriales bacterium]